MEAVEKLKQRTRGIAIRYLSWDDRNWLRIRQIEAFTAFLNDRPNAKVLEISPGWNKMWRNLCKDYIAADYPDFDVCKDTLKTKFDVVIADQVLEHVQHPTQAAKNMYKMVAPGGYAIVAVPFLFRIHARPYDFQRWTEAGLRQLLVQAGFSDADIETYSWGNKACAKAHIGGPVRDYGWRRDLHNDPEYPLQVWAFARKRAN